MASTALKWSVTVDWYKILKKSSDASFSEKADEKIKARFKKFHFKKWDFNQELHINEDFHTKN